MALLLFLIQVFVVSFSGAASPGPINTTAITMGTRSRWAGALLAVGHGIVEFPLMILIIRGLGAVFNKNAAQIIIGLAGGAVLLFMGVGMFKSSNLPADAQPKPKKGNPILAGIILTATNPFFLVWWTTTGLALALKATPFGIWAFALFAIVHWLVDLIWVSALSFASFHGTTLLGPKVQQVVLKICAAAMFFFGLFFLYNAAKTI